MDRARDPGAASRPALSAPRAALRRLLRPPRTLRPTRAGWLFFAITLGVGFAAVNTGNNLLYLVLAFMLAFLVLSGVLSESALRGVEIRRRLPREIFAGRPAPVVLEVSNRQRRVPAFAVAVEERETGGARARRGGRRRLRRRRRAAQPAGRVFVLRVAPNATERRSYRLALETRGFHQLEGFQVSTRFPFGLFSKSMLLEAPERVLAWPAVDAADAPAPAPARGARGSHAGGAGGRSAEASGLREYVPGDPLRHVHWRASVRRSELVTRELEHEQPAEVEVRLRTAGAEAGRAFEREVSRAASQIVAALQCGCRVALRTDAAVFPAEPGPRHRERLLAFLARVQPEAEARTGAAR